MSDLTDRQKYYEYRPSDGSNWFRKEEPDLGPSVQARLTSIGGLSDRGQPKLRIVWGGIALHDITEKPTLKYKAVREIITGYYYLKRDGETGTTASMNLPKDAAIPWQFHPKKERVEVGRLRWAIEQHIPAHELKRLGRFRNRKAPDGELILRKFPEEGVYDHYFWIQTKDGKYRDPDPEVITAIEAMWKYNLTRSEAQKALDALEDEENQTLVGAEEARRVWQSL